MVGTFRPRRLLPVALLGTLVFGHAACSGPFPNTTFSHRTEYNTAIDGLWNILLNLGTAVFIGVEAALVFVIYKFRRRPDSQQPKPVHGSTALEIAWTIAPAIILIFIAIPTVRTIFRTQANAPVGSLQVEAIGHQWWWEFRYPQYGFSTANELYLPVGRTVSFQLKTVDVLHSFWIPQMGGKRDLITNRTNYLWFTPNKDEPSAAYNGICAEFCGESHANMRFRTFIVQPGEFEGWVKNQQTDALVPVAIPVIPGTAGAGVAAGGKLAAGAAPATAGASPGITPAKPGAATAAGSGGATAAASGAAVANPAAGAAKPGAAPAVLAASMLPVGNTAPRAPAWTFPADKIEKDFAYIVPQTPIAAGNYFNDALLASGDAAQGAALTAMCQACHSFKPGIQPKGIPVIAPNLSHVGSRHTIAAGLYPNDDHHLSRWIKNSPLMKPGSKMPTIGKGMINPETGKSDALSIYTDQQIANIVAYLRSLK